MLDPRLFVSCAAIVAVPVRDEAERIADCLLALAGQEGAPPLGVLLLVNNTTDGTADVIRDIRPGLGMAVAVVEHDFPAAEANAGHARRLATGLAANLAPGLPLLCTDADGRAAPDWAARNLFHLASGVDAVFGRAEIDPIEAARIPPGLHRADAEEGAYGRLLDEMAHWVDPDPDDPWPRHTEHSGASIAVTAAAFRLAGGIPTVALGEDRAFAAALRRLDARIRHAPDVRVVVSGRILGRAVGGMADTIRRRLVAPDFYIDDALEPARDCLARLRLRRALRDALDAGDERALRALECRHGVAGLAAAGGFGVAWCLLEQSLARRRVAVAELGQEAVIAAGIVASLRLEGDEGLEGLVEEGEEAGL